MTTLVFGSTGSVGQYICSHLPEAVPLTRDHYDLSKPDDFSGLETFDNIMCIIWCSGMNTNDTIGTMNTQTYDDMMNVNVNSIVKSLDYFEKTNKLSRGARVCIISSILQENGRVGKLSYCVSKSAIGGLVRAASINLKERDILINAILPGPIDNEMTKRTLSMEEYDSLKKFFVRLEDVFNICHLLCFNNTSITGQSISVDNGISVKIIY
jgi:3-oxoacyl-[acyl-carrier protein] reductase